MTRDEVFGGPCKAYRIDLAHDLDAFYTVPALRQATIDPEAPPTGAALNDARPGAIAEHLARRWDRASPAWTKTPFGFLRPPYVATEIEASKEMLLAQTPTAFRRRMIFGKPEPVRRARRPRTERTSLDPAGCTRKGAGTSRRVNMRPRRKPAKMRPWEMT